MKRLILFLALGCLVAFGQTNYTLELGAGGYMSSTPHSAGVMSIILSPVTASIASYTTFEMRPLVLVKKGSSPPTLNSETGIQWTPWTSGKAEFSFLLKGGVANGATVSASMATGGKVSYWPAWKKYPGLYFHVTGQEGGMSAALGGWNPSLMIGAGYQFTGFGGGSLSSRRKAMRLQRGR